MNIFIIDSNTLELPEKADCYDWLEAHPAATTDDLLALPHSLFEADDIAGTDFDSLKERASLLGYGDHAAVDVLLKDVVGLNILQRRVIYNSVKKYAGFSLGDIRSQMAENYGEVEPDHLMIAREVIADVGSDNLISTVAHVWLWRDSGVWKDIKERELKQRVQRALEQNNHAISRSLVDAVSEVLITEIFAPSHTWDVNIDAINLVNGELHWTGEEWELREHCREHYRTTQVPHPYNPDAPCPRFIQFLEEVFAGDPDKDEKKQLVLELIGYTLMSSARLEVFVLLIGSGANGKSVLLDLIRILVGADNVAAVQPSQFQHKFQRAHLHNKLANLVTEIAEGAEIADAELKAIVSGELTTAEHKFGHPFDFRPFCTCWFGTNHLPHTRDFSDALFRRARVIQFNNTFVYGVNADPQLKDKLAEEIAGVIALSLQAFGEVLKRGHFTEPESCKKAKQEWRIEADQVAQFLGDACELTSSSNITSSELYSSYKNWAENAGVVRKLNRQNFTNRLSRLGGKPFKGAGGIRMIGGISLKSILLQEL